MLVTMVGAVLAQTALSIRSATTMTFASRWRASVAFPEHATTGLVPGRNERSRAVHRRHTRHRRCRHHRLGRLRWTAVTSWRRTRWVLVTMVGAVLAQTALSIRSATTMTFASRWRASVAFPEHATTGLVPGRNERSRAVHRRRRQPRPRRQHRNRRHTHHRKSCGRSQLSEAPSATSCAAHTAARATTVWRPMACSTRGRRPSRRCRRW